MFSGKEQASVCQGSSVLAIQDVCLPSCTYGHEDVVPDKVGGVSKKNLLETVRMMKAAKFGMTFFGMGVTQTGGRHNNIGNAIQMTRSW